MYILQVYWTNSSAFFVCNDPKNCLKKRCVSQQRGLYLVPIFKSRVKLSFPTFSIFAGNLGRMHPNIIELEL